MKIIVSGGGTGGHIYPALAVIEEIKKEIPKGRFYISEQKKVWKRILSLKRGFLSLPLM